jgi:tol-pal system protein YbgF
LTKTKIKSARNALALATMLALSAPLSAQAQLFSWPSGEGSPPSVEVAQADPAQLVLRIQQLEEQLRSVNGQVEGLTFQLTQMQELLTRTTEAYETRLKALEGGGSTATPQPSSTPQSQPAAVPDTEVPAQGVQPLPGEAEFDPTFDDGSAPSSDIGNSADPLVGTGATGGTDLATGQPIDLNYNPQTVSTGDADADAQFSAGADALRGGDYAFAEDQFSQFLELYPDNAQATQAASYLGDALMQRAAYSEAADVLLNAFQKAPSSPEAPDLLLKLGVSLAGAGERETACRTFAEIDKRYTSLAPAFVSRLGAEKTKAECPPA